MLVERYPALRIIITFADIMAYGLSALIVIAGILSLPQGGALALLGSLIVAFFVYLGVKVYSELVQVLINIEKNTRLYQDILTRDRSSKEASQSGN